MKFLKKDFFTHSIKASVFFALCLYFTSAQAQFPMFPPAPHELYPPTAPSHVVGSYSVEWQDTTGSICWLSERLNGGAWATVPNSYSPTNILSLSRSVGNYEYQVACIDDYGGKLGPISTVGVVTSMPSLDPLETQRDYQFQVRSGHFDGNGKLDIYIQRNSGDTNNGVINKTILTQTDDGHFEVVENPTSGQLATAAGWPVSTGVAPVANDYNVDGRVDVLLKHLDTTIPGVDDQIAYSTGMFFQGAAEAVAAIDFEFEKFFRDTYNWILDPNYFSQAITSNMPAYNFSLDIGVYFCNYWYGFPVCLNVGHALFEQTVTLAMLGLSGYETIQAAEEGLASALGFASYDTFECVLVCGWIEFYGWYSSTVFTFYDVWTPTTESPGFDDINFSKPASEAESALAEILNADIINGHFSILEDISEKLSDQLGIEINIGTQAANCEDAPLASNFVIAIPAAPACGVVLSGIINTIGIILVDAVFDQVEQPEPIYRAYGGVVEMEGRSWTPQFPLLVSDFRDAAGLPQVNACTKLVFGKLVSSSGMIIRSALPIINSPPGYSVNGGRVIEYFFPSPSQVEIIGGQVNYGPVINITPPC
jgi:hypothetical protein